MEGLQRKHLIDGIYFQILQEKFLTTLIYVSLVVIIQIII